MKQPEEKPIPVAVIGRDGHIEYHELAPQRSEKHHGKGRVLFPFRHTRVHSDGWKPCEHCVFKKKDDEE